MDELLLFIDRYPMRSKPTHRGGKPFDPVIPLIVTHHDVKSLGSKSYKTAHDWPFDTCCEGELITSPDFLNSQYGLIAEPIGTRVQADKNKVHLLPNGFSKIEAQSLGRVEEIPVFRANIWIVSNLAHYRYLPLKISLKRGVTAQTNRVRNLAGRNLLVGTGIKIEIDFDTEQPTFSMWVPPHLISPVH